MHSLLPSKLGICHFHYFLETLLQNKMGYGHQKWCDYKINNDTYVYHPSQCRQRWHTAATGHATDHAIGVMMSALLWLSTAPSHTQVTVLKLQALGNTNEPWPTTSHLYPQPCLIAIAIFLVVIYMEQNSKWFIGFDTSQLFLPFQNQPAMYDLPLWKPAPTVCAATGCSKMSYSMKQSYSGLILFTCIACTNAEPSNAMWHDFDLAHKPFHNNLETLLLHGLWLWHVAYVRSGLYQSCPHIFNHHAKLELA